MPYATFLSERIFKPLHMTHTYCDSPRSYGANHAYGYGSYAMSALYRPTPEGAGWVNAAGCLASTVGDLLRFDNGLMNGTLVSKATLTRMSTATTLTDGQTDASGFGMVTGNFHGHRFFGHDGGVAGFRSVNMAFPDDRSAVVILFNADNVDPGDMLGVIARKLYGMPPRKPSAAPPASAPGDAQTQQIVSVIRSVLIAFQHGKIDRTVFTNDFNAFLTPQLAAQASHNIAALGTLVSVNANVTASHGTEFTTATVAFRSRTLSVMMRRTPQGKISEFLISPAD
jgi:hypothetical protein